MVVAMAKGGPRPNSGPPPDPNALRRDRPSDAAGWLTLPADGRDGAPPEFPLSNQTERECVFWEREWRRPQAVEWERNGQEVEVALYVRALADAEKPNASVAGRTLVKQLQESLGVSLPGLARNRWRIDGDTQAPTQKASKRRAVSGKSSRDRFEVIAGGGS